MKKDLTSIPVQAKVHPVSACGIPTRRVHSLHKVAERGDTEKVQGLLNRGENPNLIDKNGDAPLHLAVMGGHTATVSVLLAGVANPNVKDIATEYVFMGAQKHKDRTPLHCAAMSSSPETVKILLSAGKEEN